MHKNETIGRLVFINTVRSGFCAQRTANGKQTLYRSVLVVGALGLCTPAIAAHHHKRLTPTSKWGEYTCVVGDPNPALWNTYPAPSGEEDRELLPETWSYVRAAMGGTESNNLARAAAKQNGTWWFSQVIGNDNSSAGYHFADMINTVADDSLYDDYFDTSEYSHPYGNAISRLYGAAFDIVLQSPTINAPGGPWPAFLADVMQLRNVGIVSWHRWYGEPGSSENEMHCIDPASPFIKSALQGQISNPTNGYMVEGTGSSGYEQDITPSNDPNYTSDWANWKAQARARQQARITNHAGIQPQNGATPLPSL